MSKRILFLVLPVILIIGLIISGCTPTPTPTPEPIELKLAHAYAPYIDDPNEIGLGQAIGEWAQKIEADSNGMVKITLFPGGSLLGNPDMFPGITGGVADIGWWDPIFDPSRFPLTLVFNVPGLKWPDSEGKLEIIQQMVDTFPELQAEIEDIKMLLYCDVDGGQLHFRDRIEVRVPEDMKGLKVHASGLLALLIQEWEAVPVEVDIFDAYIALERGTIDACMYPWGAVRAFRLHEVTQAHTRITLDRPIACMVMNLETWNSLPPDIQKVFDDNKMWGGLLTSKAVKDEGIQGRQWAIDAGALIVEVTPEEEALWLETEEVVHEAWVQEKEAMGLPGRALLDELKRLISEY